MYIKSVISQSSPVQTEGSYQAKMSFTTVGELCDKAVDKFFKDKKYLSIGGDNKSLSSNGSNDAGYCGSWNSSRYNKNTVEGGGLTSSWTSTSLQAWSRQGQKQQKESFGQKSRKEHQKP